MRGQSIVELVVLLVAIVSAVLLMSAYIKRASNGRIYGMAKMLGEGIYSRDGNFSYIRVVRQNIEIRYNYTDIINASTGNVDDVRLNKEFLSNDEYVEELYNTDVPI